MRYIKFTLKNFKGIKEVTLDVTQEKPIALVGINESGKTTILEGIEYIGEHCKLFNARNSSKVLLERVLSDEDEFQSIIPRDTDTKDTFDGSVELSCVLEDKEKVLFFTFTYHVENNTFHSYEVTVNKRKLSEFEEKARHDFLKGLNLQGKVPDILYYPDFIFAIPKEIAFFTTVSKNEHSRRKPVTGGRENKINTIWQQILVDVFASNSQQDRSYSENERKFTEKYVDFLNTNKSSSKESALRNALTMLSRHLDEKITKKWQELQGVERTSSLKEIGIRPYPKQADKNNKDVISKISFTIFVKSNQGIEYTLAERSKGCQWFFAFMLFTEFRKHRYPNTIFLLDEPASNLHAGAQEKIVEAINDLMPKSGVIYTTHSPYLLDAGNLDTAYVVENLTTSTSETGAPNIELTRFGDEKNGDKGYDRPIMDYLSFKVPDVLEAL